MHNRAKSEEVREIFMKDSINQIRYMAVFQQSPKIGKYLSVHYLNWCEKEGMK